MKTIVLDLLYLAKTYGMDGRVQFRLLEDPETSRKVYLAKTYGMDGRVQIRMLEDPETVRKVKLEMVELDPEVAADLAAIQAIGTDRPFNMAKELDEVDTLH